MSENKSEANKDFDDFEKFIIKNSQIIFNILVFSDLSINSYLNSYL